MGDQSLSITNENGKITLDGDGIFGLESKTCNILGREVLDIEGYTDIEFHTYAGNLSIHNETGNVLIYSSANLNPSMFITALHPPNNTGGLLINTGKIGRAHV